MRPRSVPSFALAAVLACLAPAACSGQEARDSTERAEVATVAEADRPPVLPRRQAVGQDLDQSRTTAIVRAARRTAPAVVSVNTIRSRQPRSSSLWDRLFSDGGQQRVPGLGSGFIIHADGLILTNEHVVRAAESIVVTLGDGRNFGAEVVGVDVVNDLALLRIDEAAPLNPDADASEPFAVAPLGDSDDLLIGEWVVAIGNPFGFQLANTEPTVTAGVVSGVGRNIASQQDDAGFYLDMIQTDASINPGNSGGPLVNALGEVIGVNSSILSSSGGSEGLGFAIPINRARRIALDLLDDGVVRRPWVGLDVEPVSDGSFARSRRVRVSAVTPGSPAEDAGLEPGAVILSAGGRALRTPLDWQAALLDASVGGELALEVARGDGSRTLSLTPVDLPSVTAQRIQALADFELVSLNPAIRAERGLVSEQGALIVDLSEAARTQLGLRRGDLILQVNQTRVRGAEQAADLLAAAAGRGSTRLAYERDGRLAYTWFYVTDER
ncbi:MAG: trypsin-like peptidase domain-containing protein [Gemmatimonadota bacterium]